MGGPTTFLRRTYGYSDVSMTRAQQALLAVLSVAGLLVSLQQTLILPFLPIIPDTLNTDVAGASWLLTASLLAGAITMPVFSRIADFKGPRLVIVACLCLMVLGGVCGVLAPGLGLAVVARGFQGATVSLVPVSIALVYEKLAPQHRAFGVGLLTSTLAVGAGVGLPLAGVLNLNADWRAIFWVPGALALCLLPFIIRVTPRPVVRLPLAIPWASVCALTLGLSGFLLAISRADLLLLSPMVFWALIVAVVFALALWIFVELRSPSPLVPLRTLGRGRLLKLNTASLLLGFGMFANLILTSYMIQDSQLLGGQALGMAEASLWLTPVALAFGVVAPIASRLCNQLGASRMLMLGAVLTAIAYAARALLTDSMPGIFATSIAVAAATALAFTALPIVTLESVPQSLAASATGFSNLMRSIGTAASSSTVAVLLGLRTEVRITDTWSISPGQSPYVAVMVLVCVLCLLAALIVPRTVTMAQPRAARAAVMDHPR